MTKHQLWHKIVVLLTYMDLLINCIYMQTAFTNKKDFGKGERQAEWAYAQRTLHGLNKKSEGDNAGTIFNENSSYRELSELAEQAKRRAEIARLVFYIFLSIHFLRIILSKLIVYASSRLRELHTLKGHVESVVKLKGLDIETIQGHYTV